MAKRLNFVCFFLSSSVSLSALGSGARAGSLGDQYDCHQVQATGKDSEWIEALLQSECPVKFGPQSVSNKPLNQND